MQNAINTQPVNVSTILRKAKRLVEIDNALITLINKPLTSVVVAEINQLKAERKAIFPTAAEAVLLNHIIN